MVATGKRVTRTIPAGQMGNATAIISTHEEWFAPDLKIELSRNDVDPFRGTHTTSVSTLSKTEPDASLFKVPTGYTVQQAPQRAFGRRGTGWSTDRQRRSFARAGRLIAGTMAPVLPSNPLTGA